MDNRKGPIKNTSNAYLKYSGMAFQLAAAILLGVLIGQWLDKRFHLEKPLFTALFALLFTLGGMYLVLKDLIFPKQDEPS